MVQKNLSEIARAVLPDAHGSVSVHAGQPLPADASSAGERAAPAQDSGRLLARSVQCIPFLLMLFAIGLVAQVTVLSPHRLAWNTWAYSEWLINYDAGFIRRGLSGALIEQVHQVPALQVVNLVVFAGFTAFCLLFWWVLSHAARGAPWAVMLAMLVPNGPVQMALGNEIFYRKEIVFHVALGISCILYRMIVSAATDARRVLLSWIFFALSLAQCIGFPLFHEVYLFISFPALWLLARQVAALQPQRRVFGRLGSATVVVSLGMMAVCALFRGSPVVAQQLWHALSATDRMLIAPLAPDTPTGGIDAIGWSAFGNLGVVGEIVLSSQFWIWGFAAAGAGAVLVLVTSLRRGEGEPDSLAAQLLRRHLSQLGFLFIASLPMYALGADWARWLSSVAISYLFLSFADSTASIEPPHLLRFVPLRWRARFEVTRDYVADRVVPAISLLTTRHKLPLLMLALFYCLTFRPPECCMSGGYNPFYRIKPVLTELVHLPR